MTNEQISALKEQITTEINSLKNQICSLEAKTKPISPDCGLGRLTRLEAMGESHVNNKVLDESRLRLIRLKNALSRTDNEMFGICINCEEEIGMPRMSIRPESVRCVECANKA